MKKDAAKKGGRGSMAAGKAKEIEVAMPPIKDRSTTGFKITVMSTLRGRLERETRSAGRSSAEVVADALHTYFDRRDGVRIVSPEHSDDDRGQRRLVLDWCNKDVDMVADDDCPFDVKQITIKGRLCEMLGVLAEDRDTFPSEIVLTALGEYMLSRRIAFAPHPYGAEFLGIADNWQKHRDERLEVLKAKEALKAQQALKVG